MYIGSIIIPWILSTGQIVSKGPKILFGRDSFLYWLLLVILSPIYPVLLVLKESTLTEASKTYEVSLKQLSTLQNHVGQFVKADLGIESHCQVILTIILILLATSETRTIVGFEVMFENETFFYLPTDIALAISIGWSLISCKSAFCKGISKKRKHSSIISNGIITMYATISIFIKTFSIVLFWTPCLGLMNCLRHLQGEMYPFWNPYFQHVNPTTDTFYFGDAKPMTWSKITRWNYFEYGLAEPPNEALYTLFTIQEYFIGFMITFMLNICLQIVVKKCTNPKVFARSSWIDLIVHGISSTFIPYPMQEWDEEKGTVSDHRSRKDVVFKEMLASMMLNFAINLLLLTPLIILSINIFERHDLLVNTIGTFPEENQAFLHIKLMLALGYSLLVLMTMVQVISYYYCNGRFHPFATIVMPEEYKYTQSLGTPESSTEC